MAKRKAGNKKYTDEEIAREIASVRASLSENFPSNRITSRLIVTRTANLLKCGQRAVERALKSENK